VLAELWRGRDEAAERAFLKELNEEPSCPHPRPRECGSNRDRSWENPGERGIERRGGCGSVHFEVLIALTARGHGARLVTGNGPDFKLIQKYRDFAPWRSGEREIRIGCAGLPSYGAPICMQVRTLTALMACLLLPLRSCAASR